MGWVHAGLVIVAVIGGSSWLAQMPFPISDALIMDAANMRQFHDTRLAVIHLMLMVPPPVVMGITIWRGKAFGEPSRTNRRVTLPGWAVVGFLGLWWIMLWGSVGMYQLARWLGW